MTANLSAPLRRLFLALLLLLLAACGGSAEPEQGPVVLAASSLQEALTEAAEAWTAQDHPAPVLSFAATSALARQVEQGAPADLFVSADEEWMSTLDERGLLRANTRRDLLSNRLVVVRAKGDPIAGFAELGDRRLALADPAAVPAGKYAQEALERMGTWPELEPKVVPAENVRAALALVERGEAPLGIVYVTDALASDGVEVVQEIPAETYTPVRYPAAVLASSQHPDAAGFLAFLSSAEAKRIFEKHGFRTLP
jgi:molybdate transport system substrate-binding protein